MEKGPLSGYTRNDAEDFTVMREIFAAENKQNDRDGASTLAMTEV